MTLLEHARAGTVTSALREAALSEGLDAEELRTDVAAGLAVVLKPGRAEGGRHVGLGPRLACKVNANLGSSSQGGGPRPELEKLRVAVEAGADAVMDLSIGSDLEEILAAVLEESPLPVGTVPVYAAAARAAGGVQDLEREDFLEEIERQAAAGVSFMTIHAGITRRSLGFLDRPGPGEASRGGMGLVSRGGALLRLWMRRRERENPLYEAYDEILDICRRHEVVISLGDGLRPGAIADAGDPGQLAELLELGILARRAREAGVQAIVEGPGHVPLNDVPLHIRLMKRLSGGAPAYVLGPLSTDRAAGHDHVAAAIGGAAAAAAGADFLCCVTPAEHLCLPDASDVRIGVISAKIAAHSGDLARGLPGAAGRDGRMSTAREALDWEAMFAQALDPAEARRRRGEIAQSCSMCGALCAVKNSTEASCAAS